MGVKSLWGVISSSGHIVGIGSPGDPLQGSPARADPHSFDLEEHMKNLSLASGQDIGTSFAGKAVAIDLSCWVCDSQANQNMHSVTKPHLRNLLFRTWSLVSVGVLPVYVVEGEAPELKQSTMKARNAARGGGTGGTKPATRKRFNSVLKECCELFRLLGLPWVQAVGEAEATCAALYYNNAVNGVITEDSDVLLYGGDKVLRNFAVHTNRPTAELFMMNNIEREVSLPRDALIVLSLLLGCDYLPAGVPGVGVAAGVQLVQHWAKQGHNALQRFESWCHKIRDYNGPKPKFLKKGTIEDLELAVMYRAVHTEGYPFTAVTQEFSQRIQIPSHNKFTWAQPDYTRLVSWCTIKLGWEADYAAQKVALFNSRWTVCNGVKRNSDHLTAESILRCCVRGGMASYIVKWTTPSEDSSDTSLETVEPQRLVDSALPHLVEAMNEQKLQLKQAKKLQKKKTTKVDGKKPPARSKKTSAVATDEKQMKITDTFLKKGPAVISKKSDCDSRPLIEKHNSLPNKNSVSSLRAAGSSKNSLLKEVQNTLVSDNETEMIDRNQSNLPVTRKKGKQNIIKIVHSNCRKSSSSVVDDNETSVPTAKCLRGNAANIVNLNDSDEEVEPKKLPQHLASPPQSNISSATDDIKFDYQSFDEELYSDEDTSKDDVSFIIDRFINKNKKDITLDNENRQPPISFRERAAIRMNSEKSSSECESELTTIKSKNSDEYIPRFSLVPEEDNIFGNVTCVSNDFSRMSPSKACLKNETGYSSGAFCGEYIQSCVESDSSTQESSQASHSHDESRDMFDESSDQVPENENTKDEHKMAGTSGSQKPTIDVPNFKLFDSGWLDSESFLSSPIQTETITKAYIEDPNSASYIESCNSEEITRNDLHSCLNLISREVKSNCRLPSAQLTSPLNYPSHNLSAISRHHSSSLSQFIVSPEQKNNASTEFSTSSLSISTKCLYQSSIHKNNGIVADSPVTHRTSSKSTLSYLQFSSRRPRAASLESLSSPCRNSESPMKSVVSSPESPNRLSAVRLSEKSHISSSGSSSLVHILCLPSPNSLPRCKSPVKSNIMLPSFNSLSSALNCTKQVKQPVESRITPPKHIPSQGFPHKGSKTPIKSHNYPPSESPSFSPLLEQPSLAERMKLRLGKKALDALS